MAVGSTSATELAFAGVARQAELVRTGEVSSRELVELCLDRIFRLDQQLNAFRVVLAEQALAAADQADARRRAGSDRPLLGVPIAVKDDQDVRGEVTTFGAVTHGPPAAQDEEIVRRLREAGAVVVGKTNVPELMTMHFTETAWYGATRNPWDLDRTPGGSSGGSAAAVAAGLVAGATASDGAGSIRIPAAFSGLFGLKCQRGRIPSPPHWHGMSTYGVVTRTVADTALMYDVVKESGPSFQEAAQRPPGRLRIAVSTFVPKPIMGRPDATTLRTIEAMSNRLRDLGHEVFERDPEYGSAVGNVIARYLRGIHDHAKTLPDPRRLQRRSRGLSRMGAAIPPALLRRALEQEDADRERIGRVFDGADLLMTPMWTRIPQRIGAFEGYGGLRSFDEAARMVPYCSPWNHTGQPAMSVPAGWTDQDVPLAVQFVAPPDGEPLLLSLASQLEQDIRWPERQPPFASGAIG
jgi:amidase